VSPCEGKGHAGAIAGQLEFRFPKAFTFFTRSCGFAPVQTLLAERKIELESGQIRGIVS
jgi:hypothetical protein